MDSDNEAIEYNGLIYERTDDMSVLSEFYCGIFEMDDFIHHNLQEAINHYTLETYIVEDSENEIVAMFSICNKQLKTKLSTGDSVIYETKEIEYLAVNKQYQHHGIGRSIINLIIDRFMEEKNMIIVSAYIDVDTGYSAEPFYEKCGFIRIGGPLHPMAQCVRMIRYI